MPYYVYAIHAGSRINHLCGSFIDYQGAEICERDNQRDIDFKENHFVMMIYAGNKTQALQKIRQIRLEKGLPKK
jgi:hypothetical protein